MKIFLMLLIFSATKINTNDTYSGLLAWSNVFLILCSTPISNHIFNSNFKNLKKSVRISLYFSYILMIILFNVLISLVLIFYDTLVQSSKVHDELEREHNKLKREYDELIGKHN